MITSRPSMANSELPADDVARTAKLGARRGERGEVRRGEAPYRVQVLGIDLRSLAAFRIAAGLVVLADLLLRARYLSAFYTDGGILPRIARLELYELVDPSGFRHLWSFHMASGQYWAQLVLFLAAGLFACWLTLGYRTRLAACMTWVLLYSLDARNPAILDSGDVLLRNLLLWALFLPLGARCSLDQRARPSPLPPHGHIYSLASAAIILQLCMMYWFSVLHKTHPCWLRDFTAVYFALSNDIFASPLGQQLLAYPRLLQVLTGLTYGLELFGPLLIFSPLRTGLCRLAAVAAFLLLHLSLGLALEIGIFAPICMIAWLLIVPAEFWDVTVPRLRALRRPASWQRLREGAARLADVVCRHPECPRLKPAAWSSAVVLVLLIYVVLWNVRELDLEYWAPRILPRESNVIGRITGLEQRWSMFSPVPSTDDGWYVMKGILRDGTEVNLWQPGEPLAWEKPGQVSRTYVSQRWRKYLDGLKHEGFAGHRLFFANWLQERWNRRWSGGDPQRELAELELVFQFEETPPPGESAGPPIRTLLWTWRYPPRETREP